MWSTVRHVKHSELQMRGRVQEGYRHTLRNARGNLYLAVRRYLGLSRDQFAHLIGISTYSLRYRERAKVLYHPLEVGELYRVSGMTAQQFTELLNDIA
jgi:DNA-binding XRE family transcriptional regulator